MGPKKPEKIRFAENIEESVEFNKDDSPEQPLREERDAITSYEDGIDADLDDIRASGSRGDIFMDQSEHAQRLNEQTAEKQEQSKAKFENSGPDVEVTEASRPSI